jgi:hypothetical protein
VQLKERILHAMGFILQEEIEMQKEERSKEGSKEAKNKSVY